jgi:hypothetical protein
MLQRVMLHAGMGSELAAVSENDHEALNTWQKTIFDAQLLRGHLSDETVHAILLREHPAG